MTILVTTGGPVMNIPSVPEAENRSFTDLVNVISDELDDTGNEYVLQIQRAILTAIRFCEHEPLYFNENRELVFLTEEGRAWYHEDDAAGISRFSASGKVLCADRTGRRRQLQYRKPDVMEQLSGSSNSRGMPRYYTHFAQKLRLYPVPDNGGYSVTLVFFPGRLQTASPTGEEMPWLREAFDLVKARAKYELYKDILKDAPLALAALNDFHEQLAILREETSRLKGTGYVRTTVF